MVAYINPQLNNMEIASRMRQSATAVTGSTAAFAKYNNTMLKVEKTTNRVVKQTAASTVANRNLGKAGKAAMHSFDGMTESIGKATMKVGLWMVATTAIVGTLQKIASTIQLWKDLEVTLARIGITTGKTGQELLKYFNDTADVAARMGMPIEKTLQGMDLALRATASIGDEAKRTSTAITMLRDAAILGNVAGMDFAQAIDILVGSLKQTGMELNQGIVLLDKWVAVSKTAGVSVNDLSQGFAIMSSAAAAAGLNVDQVNGLITSLSETTTLGSVEVGNAIRALMATLFNEGSVKTLNKYGIAVRNATGEFRGFWEIMSEVSSMQMTGALDETAMLEIAKAAGAGQRRYAQFLALIENWSAATRAATVSANAQGDALLANDKIVETLTNSWDKFTASQNKFWYNFGQNSGAIEDLTDAMNFMGKSFAWISEGNAAMSKMVKIVLTLTAGLLAMKLAAVGLQKLGVSGMLGRAGAGVAGLTGAGTGLAYNKAPYSMFPQQSRGVKARASLGRLGGRMTQRGGVGGGLAAGMIGGMIVKEITDSDYAGVGAGIAGGIGMVLGGPVGAAVGAVIGGVIGKFIEDSSKTAADRIKEITDRAAESYDTSAQAIIADASLALMPVPTTFKPSDDKIVPFEEALAGAKKELLDASLLQRKEQTAVDVPIGTRKVDAFGESLIRKSQEDHDKELENLATYSAAVDVAEVKVLAFVESQRQALVGFSATPTTIYEDIASRTQEIINDVDMMAGDKSLQAVFDELFGKTAEKRGEVPLKELDNQLNDVISSFAAYPKILAQLEAFSPDNLEEFLKTDFSSFVDKDAAAFAPLLGALADLQDMEKDQQEQSLRIGIASGYMGELEATEENIKAVRDQYALINADVAKSGGASAAYFESIKKEYPALQDIPYEQMEAYSSAAKEALDAALLHIDANRNLGIEQEKQNILVEEYIDYMSRYKAPSTLAFLAPTTGDIDAIIKRLEGQLGIYLEDVAKTDYTAITQEEGIVGETIGEFNTWSVVWQAMLAELGAIEQNTGKEINAQYNLPAGYVAGTNLDYYASGGAGTSSEGAEAVSEALVEAAVTIVETIDDWMLQIVSGKYSEIVSNKFVAPSGDSDFSDYGKGYATGIDFVPKTGKYTLHQGETVISNQSGGFNLNKTNNILAMSQGYLSSMAMDTSAIKREMEINNMLLSELLSGDNGSGGDFASMVSSGRVSYAETHGGMRR